MKQILALCGLAVGLHAQTGVSVLPHLALGGGWITSLYLTNANTQNAVVCQLRLVSDTGGPLVAAITESQQPGANPMNSIYDLTITAGTVDKVVLTASPATSGLVEGSAWVSCPGDVFVLGVFSFGVQSAAVATTSSSSSFVISYDNTGGLAAGIAITSTDMTGNTTATTTIAIRANDGFGAFLGNYTLNLPYQGHTAFVLTDQLPATAGTIGTLLISCSPACSVLGTEANGTAYTSLPAFALAQ